MKLTRPIKISFIFTVFFLWACSTLMPVEPSDEVTELSFNHWLLQRLYLKAEAELLPLSDYDSVATLYESLSDPYTRYIPPAKADDQRHNDTSTSVPGALGIEIYHNVQADSARLEIYRIYPYSPAGYSDLQRWDRLLAINGESLTHDSAFTVFSRVRDHNKILHFSVLRAGESGSDTVELSIEKGVVFVPSVFVDTMKGIEVIAIAEFTRHTEPNGNGTAEELQKALRQTSAQQPRIIDIRNNPGGEVSVCLAVANEFVAGEQPLVHLVSHSFTSRGVATIDTVTYISDATGASSQAQFYLLANEYSASCAEIFLGVIQDLRPDITTLGTTTYGKGIGQTRWDTPEGGLASITSIAIRTPLWRDYHAHGLTVEITAPENPLSQALLLINPTLSLPKLANTSPERTILAPDRKMRSPQAWISGSK